MTDPLENIPTYTAPDSPHHDDTDVNLALENDTDDGKGGAVVPKKNFVSYAHPDADKEEDS